MAENRVNTKNGSARKMFNSLNGCQALESICIPALKPNSHLRILKSIKNSSFSRRLPMRNRSYLLIYDK